MLLLRHPDQVFELESIQSAYLKPITLWHPDPSLAPDGEVNVGNIDDIGDIGTIGNTHRIEGLDLLLPFVINKPAGLDALDDGLRAVSMVHKGDYRPESGVWRDPRTGVDHPYTHREYNIRYSSMAIVDSGRAGPQARIPYFLDRAQPEGARSMKIMINGIEYEAAPEVCNALRAAEAANVTALSDRATATTAQETLAGQLAAEKLKTAALQDKLDKLPALLKDQAEGRKKLSDRAKEMGMSDEEISACDSMSDADFRKAALKKVNPETDLSDKSEDYVSGMWDNWEGDDETSLGDRDEGGEGEVAAALRRTVNGGARFVQGAPVKIKSLQDRANDGEYLNPVEASQLRVEQDANAWRTTAAKRV